MQKLVAGILGVVGIVRVAEMGGIARVVTAAGIGETMARTTVCTITGEKIMVNNQELCMVDPPTASVIPGFIFGAWLWKHSKKPTNSPFKCRDTTFECVLSVC